MAITSSSTCASIVLGHDANTEQLTILWESPDGDGVARNVLTDLGIRLLASPPGCLWIIDGIWVRRNYPFRYTRPMSWHRLTNSNPTDSGTDLTPVATTGG